MNTKIEARASSRRLFPLWKDLELLLTMRRFRRVLCQIGSCTIVLYALNVSLCLCDPVTPAYSLYSTLFAFFFSSKFTLVPCPVLETSMFT